MRLRVCVCLLLCIAFFVGGRVIVCVVRLCVCAFVCLFVSVCLCVCVFVPYVCVIV